MPNTAVIGADVIINGPLGAIFGQRGAKLSGSTDMIDMTVKEGFPNKSSRPGWNGVFTLECDCLLAHGDEGYMYWFEQSQLRAPIDVEIHIGDGGEVLGRRLQDEPAHQEYQHKNKQIGDLRSCLATCDPRQ